MIRTLRPTDLVAYLSFRGRAGPNEALLRPNDTPTNSSLKGFITRSLSIDPRCESWLQIQDGRIDGLVGARSRFGSDIWDIDQLICLSHESGTIYRALLRHLTTAASEEGVQKIFLRVMAGSSAVEAARSTGFFQYAVERVYQLGSLATRVRSAAPALRPRRRADHHALFQLYCSVVPVVVRQVEGMTLQEWRWTEGWGMRPPMNWRMDLPRARRDFVLEKDLALSAWLQVKPRFNTIWSLLRPEEQAEVPGIIRYGLSQLASGKPAYCTVREYQTFLEPVLQGEGFELIAEQALLARVLAVRVQEPRLVPMRAHLSR
ncbi:MAG: hypothetical protein HY675_06530 [Chloroflexi bacterium]|nr:hypothetical protein [Chloroflexota bacterium]